MQVILEVPEDLAPLISESTGGLTKVALEALALEVLRSGKISVAQGRLLGISSRYEMDGFLKGTRFFFRSPLRKSSGMRRRRALFEA